MKRAAVIAISIAIVILFFEWFLRYQWGFADTVLMREDPHYEYIAQPNQIRNRFGNRIVYNEHSMRSMSVQPTDSLVILGFGDSIINGGVQTDHDSLATTLLEHMLQSDGMGYRVLNVSAGSWGRITVLPTCSNMVTSART